MSWLYPVIPLIATALLVASLIGYQGGYEQRQDLKDVKASIPEDMGYVIVKVTERDHDGLMLPILEPKDLELWYPFNTYIIFVNELGYEVKVTILYKDDVYDSFSIPVGGILARALIPPEVFIGRSMQDTFTYSVYPTGLGGSILVNGYPACMNKEQAEMLFGLVGVDVKFPKYLPEGYKHECTVHVFNNAAWSFYSNAKIREIKDTYELGYIDRSLYEDHGGIIISTGKLLSYNTRVTLEEEYSYIKDYYDPNAILLPDKRMIGYNFVTIHPSYNIVIVYYDDHIYSVGGKLPIDELIRVASSLE